MSARPPVSRSGGLPHGLRAFRHRPFRRFYAGQTISVVGSWIQSIALSWLVYRLSGSASLLGLTAFLTQAPILLLGPLAGTLADRLDRRRLLLAAQWALALQAAVLGLSTLSGWHTVGWLLTMAGLQGLVAAFETPARQTFLGVLVPDRDDLPNAVALNSFLMNSGRLVGPTVAGLLLVAVGEGVCFLVNAVSFLAAIAAIAAAPAESRRDRARDLAGSGLLVGLAHAWHHPLPRRLLPAVATVSFFASPYAALMPAVVRESFGNSATLLGLLVGGAGLGGLAGTGALANWRSMTRLPLVTTVSCALAGASLLAFSATRDPSLALACMPALGFGIIATAASVNMLLQWSTPESLRGRIVSLYLASFLGMAPFGALAGGVLADRFGVRPVLAGGGVACLLMASWLAFGSGAGAVGANLADGASRSRSTR